MAIRVFTSGQVAEQLGLPRWKLLYLVDSGQVPAPALLVPGRRLFTEQDVAIISRRLEEVSNLKGERGEDTRVRP